MSPSVSAHVSAALNGAVYGIPTVLSQAKPGDGIRKTAAGFELVPASTIARMTEVFDGYREGMVLVDGRVFKDALPALTLLQQVRARVDAMFDDTACFSHMPL